MARFIINSKVYDTEKMEFIATAKMWHEFTDSVQKQMFGGGIGHFEECKLYKSVKGNWLLTHEDGSHLIGGAIEEREAKKLLMKCDYAAYMRLYGELEEA